MTRTRKRQALAVIIAAALGVQAVVVINATAQSSLTQQIPTTTWTISPNSLSGVGAFFAAHQLPVAATGQEVENKYQYGLVFRFTGAAQPFGIVSLDTEGVQKFASLALNNGTGTVTHVQFPYNFEANKFYFLFVALLPGNAVAGFVLDVATATYTFIGALRANPAWGDISGVASTLVRWYGPPQSDCAAYPRSDTFWSVPFGFVPGDPNPHMAMGGVNAVAAGDCPGTVATEPDANFRHYVLGSSAGPTTTSTSTSSTSTSSTSTSSTSSSTTSSSTSSTSSSTTSTSIAA